MFPPQSGTEITALTIVTAHNIHSLWYVKSTARPRQVAGATVREDVMNFDVTSMFDRRADKPWDRVSVGDLFERVAYTSPDAEALVGAPGAYVLPEFERLSYDQANHATNRIANALRARGIGRGDRVLFVCENSIEALLTKFGVAKLGAVAVPINPSQTAEVLAHAVKLTEPRMVFADAEHGGLPAAIGLDVNVTIPIGTLTGQAGEMFSDFLAGAPSSETPEATVHGDDIWQILFTSGTTAMPKGVMTSHTYAYLTALSYALPYTRGLPHESMLRIACFPPILFHVGDQAYAMPALLSGGTIILGRRYRPQQIVATIAAERATTVIGGGLPLVQRLIDEFEAQGPAAARSLTCLVYGLGVMPSELQVRLKLLCPNMTPVLIAGQTECVSGHRFMPDVFKEKQAEVIRRGANLIGKPSPLLASRIVDVSDGTTPVEPTVIGELAYRSPVMMAGYYKDEDATRKALQNGWLRSGDLGTGDPDGYRFIVGRMKDVIKTGGENVSSTRVEGILSQHPAIAQAAVVGLPDPNWGEVVVGVVVVAAGATVTEAEIIAFCRERLAGFETPKRVVVRDELPMDFLGKVRKYALRETLLASSGVTTS